MNANKITDAQKKKLAERLALLSDDKKKLFRSTLEKEGIDPWHLPIIAEQNNPDGRPLSFSQQRLWFIEQMEPGNPMYNLFFALRFEGDLNTAALEYAINKVVLRHETLRTNYVSVNGEGRQVLREFTPLAIDVLSLPASSDSDDKNLNDLMQQEAKTPFDLVNDKHMLRAKLVVRQQSDVDGKSESIGLFTFHHIAFDALSTVVFMREINEFYAGYLKSGGANPSNAEFVAQYQKDIQEQAPIQYADFAQWQRDWGDSQSSKNQANYWQNQLADAPSKLGQATQYKRPEVITYDGDVADITLSSTLSDKLLKLAQNEDATLYMVLLAGFNILLSRYSQNDDVCVGTSVANRPKPELESLLGFFVNTLVMRNRVKPKSTFKEFLSTVAEVATSAYSNQDLPFDQLLELLNVEREQNSAPIFQVLFVLNNALDDLKLQLGGVDLSVYPTPLYYSRFDLTLRVTEKSAISKADGIRLEMEFNTALYSKAMVDRLLRHYEQVLTQIVNNPDIPLNQLSVLTHAESKGLSSLPEKFGNADNLPSNINTIQSQFEYWAHKTPDAPALVFEDQMLNYAQLNGQANQLAHYLREKGVAAEKRVGILLDRSADFIISVLAVLKAGGSYVPLDNHWPAERINRIVVDADLSVMLSESQWQNLLPNYQGNLILLDSTESEFRECSNNNPEIINDSSNGAYLIYTSGSTGEPKGVVIEHGHLLNYVSNVVERLNLAGKSFGLISTIAADLGNTSIYGAFCYGGALHVISNDRANDATELATHLKAHPVDVLKIVPSHIRGLLAALDDASDANTLSKFDVLPKHCLILGGEACTLELVNQVSAIAPECRIVNHYGPTETTVGALTYEYDKNIYSTKESLSNALPVGLPIPGNKIYVVDTSGQLCPVGVSGELLISGVSVARGYLNRPELNQERFIDNVYLNSENTSDSYSRCYRTGDKVRQLPTGDIEFLGRLDEQIKVRGYRVEIGEVETLLQFVEGVKQSAVIAVKNEDDQNQLSAYVVVEDRATLDDVKARLENKVPDYMVPQWFVALEELPLTTNGKVDRKNLPDPKEFSAQSSCEDAFQAPRDEKEILLAKIWCDVLRIENVSIDANFFELGGDSILSLQIIARAKKAGLKITPKQLFEHKTIAGVAAVAEQKSKPAEAASGNKTNAKVLDTSEFPLLPIQQWFFDANHPEPNHWNQSAIFTVESSLNVAALDAAVSALIEHHDALRLRFVENNTADQKIVNQYYHPEIDKCVCQCIDIPAMDDWQGWIESKATEIQKSLNIHQGPLINVCYFDAKGQDGINSQLLIVIHHLVIDGVSWRILLSDFQQAYGQAVAQLSGSETTAVNKEKVNITLGEKSASYKQWASHLSEYANSSSVKQQIDYWQKTESVGDFPVNKADGNNTLATVNKVSRELSVELTEDLVKSVPAIYRTQINDVLLTALTKVISTACQSDWVLVEVEGHGREDIGESPDLSQTLGWFTSRFPVYLNANADSNVGSLLAVKEQLREVPANGIGFALLRYLKNDKSAELEQALAERQKAPVCFNYLGQFDLELNEQSLLSVSDISSGIERSEQSQRGFYLDLNAFIHDGKLCLEWLYSSDIHEQQWMSELADNYLETLTALITDCVNDEVGGATPSDFPLANLTQPQINQLSLPWREVESVYPLTQMQEGLLFHTLMNPGTGIYFMQYRYEVNAQIDQDAFVEAWARVVERHEVLRTAFLRQDERMLQMVYKKVPPPVQIFDWREFSEQEQSDKLQQWMAKQVEQGFDLSTPTQMAVTLIRVGDDKYNLVRSFHHILMDAWCFSLLMMDFITYYRAIVADKTVEISPPRPFRDYIAWLQQQDINKAEQFWRESLSGFEAPTPLAVDKPQSVTGVKDVIDSLTPQETDRLTSLAQKLHITLNTFVQGAWGLLLSRYSGNEDIIFGVTVAGRPTELEGAESVVGLFINSLPLRIQATSDRSVSDYLTSIFESNINMREHEFAPLVDIHRWSDLPPGETLFRSLFVYENAPVDPEMLNKMSIFEVEESDNRTHTNYPITVVIFPGEKLGLQLTYDRSLFDHNSIERMMSQFKLGLLNLGDAVETELAQQSFALNNVEILPKAEQQKQLLDWNQTYTDYPRERCWPELFVEQVEKTPNAIAASCGDEQITYQDLFNRSQSLGRKLIKSGVEANDIVAILDERGIDLLTMIVAVLSSGAAYLPLDPAHPEKRLASILELSRPKAIVSTQAFLPTLDTSLTLIKNGEKTPPVLLSIEDTLKADSDNYPIAAQFNLTYRPNDLAYVIYTSGSTGVPKGAMVEHLGMLNNQYSKIPTLSLTENDVIAQTASQCFDISVWQFLTALLCGAKVEIYPDEIARHPMALLEAVEKDGVTVLESVPSLIQGFLTQSFLDYPKPLSTLRWLMPTGEALSQDLAKRWLQQYPTIPLLNAYGPAECADDVALWPVATEKDTNDPMPIGQPTDNNYLYVLNDQQKLQPIGVPGELYVAGAGVGRGYLHDEERTAAAFIKNPLLAHPVYRDNPEFVDSLDNSERFYRTGDIARWREDGVLEYLGRTDHQVKIRGFRIELGEIESCLESHNDIRHAAVVVQKDLRGDDSLVAFYEAQLDNDEALTDERRSTLEASLVVTLKEALPVYMQPSLLIGLAKMPLNNNGKIDRRSLPAADFSQGGAANSDKEIAQPRNEMEKTLVDLWQHVLKIEDVDIHASFFELGGHSLLAAQLHARVGQTFAIDLPLRTLFEHNSVAQVAEQVELALAAKSLENSATIDSDDGMEEFEI